jgi:hypothetical protein
MKFFKAIPLALAVFTTAVSALPILNQRSVSDQALAARGEIEDIANLAVLEALEARDTVEARSDAEDMVDLLNALDNTQPGSLAARDLEARVSDEIFNTVRSLLERDLEADELDALRQLADAGSSLVARDLESRNLLGVIWNGAKNLVRKLTGKPTIPTVKPSGGRVPIERRNLLGVIWNGAKNLVRKLTGKPTIPTVKPSGGRVPIERRNLLGVIWNGAKNLVRKLTGKPTIPSVKPSGGRVPID